MFIKKIIFTVMFILREARFCLISKVSKFEKPGLYEIKSFIENQKYIHY